MIGLQADPTLRRSRRHRQAVMPLAWFTALVHGPSMAPTMRHGDRVLVRVVEDEAGGRSRGAGTAAGDVVVARFRSRPDLLVVKRVVRREGDGWWLAGDNPYGTDDSRTYGVADVVGRVVLRWWPRPRLITGRR
jgi:phage repressor protein C with HTH and peptisase S24 domain